uniref:Protein BUD31 homolog 2 n=1 Tax=Tanacetum cinerariifolium TaxID=118510 RepID=A0A699H6Z4_TANCI|nr:protein BUD31 homolog 2 [Tanacetum cinerariifolium]GEX43378.1 protein BUD31 homolog 2 [Tanacetum cinerariifolium]
MAKDGYKVQLDVYDLSNVLTRLLFMSDLGHAIVAMEMGWVKSTTKYFFLTFVGSHNNHSMNTLPTGENIIEQHIIHESQHDTGMSLSYVHDVKSRPLCPHDEYQQFELVFHVKLFDGDSGFYANSLADDDYPPIFLRTKVWKIHATTLNICTLSEANRINVSLRSRLPDLNFSLSSKVSDSVVVGKYNYAPACQAPKDEPKRIREPPIPRTELVGGEKPTNKTYKKQNNEIKLIYIFVNESLLGVGDVFNFRLEWLSDELLDLHWFNILFKCILKICNSIYSSTITYATLVYVRFCVLNEFWSLLNNWPRRLEEKRSQQAATQFLADAKRQLGAQLVSSLVSITSHQHSYQGRSCKGSARISNNTTAAEDYEEVGAEGVEDDAENDPHDGKRKCEALWPVFKIAHEQSHHVFDLYHHRKEISAELLEFCLDQGYADRNLIAKWKKASFYNGFFFLIKCNDLLTEDILGRIIVIFAILAHIKPCIL